ncbi:MAG TPA: hypothetical protein VGF21_04285 [Thermoleophilaceae bacterium]|jgi:hypothetical protein
MHRTRILTLVGTALIAAGVVGCGSDGSSGGAAEGSSRPPFTIKSTLDGRKVVPHHIRWLAFPKLKGGEVESVAFLIDGGRPRWVEKDPPYTFGDDENGEHKGYLVTSWLTPGEHRFTVRAVASDGRKSTDTVVARVRPAPEPPGDLGGAWRRKVSDTSGAPEPGSPGNPTETLTPPGTYEMAIDRRWIQVRFPGKYRVPQSDDTGEGWILDSDYSAGATSLRVFGAVTFDTHHGQAELGWWCWPDGPPANYRWSTNGNTLTLTPKGTDPCSVRSFIWAGDWTRSR